jgi:hypothetical protein
MRRVGGERRWGLIVLVAVAIAFLGAFIAVVALDVGQRVARTPPGGVESFENLSREHTEGNVDYEQSLPVDGEHNPVWQNCGFYDKPVRSENAVHSLEHGAVWITYQPRSFAPGVGSRMTDARPYSEGSRWRVYSKGWFFTVRRVVCRAR